MKTIKSFLAIAAVTAGALGASGHAMAEIISGTQCRALFADTANAIAYSSDGIKNVHTSQQRWIICPLSVTHTPDIVNGEITTTLGTVNIDVRTTKAIRCTLYSYSELDVFLGSKTVTIPIGRTSTPLGTVPATPTSNHSIICNLSPNGLTKIIAIETTF